MADFKLTTIKSPVDVRDWIAETIFNQTYPVPTTFSLMNQLPTVRDQGPYGTCASFAASAIKEYQEKVDIGLSGYMSPQFVYNHRTNAPSEGMYARDVMDILKNKGICQESDYPYTSQTPITKEILDKAKKYVISSYASVTTIDGVKRALIKSGPCYIAFPVYNFGNRFWKATQGATFLGGHAVSIVGYTKSGFIIRNSWSDKWNGNGYTIFPYEDFGSQWEIWTTVDADSGKIPVKKPTIIQKIIRKIKINFALIQHVIF